MSPHTVLELALGAAAFLGIVYRIRESGKAVYGKFAPDILIGFLLLLNALTTSFGQKLPSLFSALESGLVITLFLPPAGSLAEKGKAGGGAGRRSGLLLASGLCILAFHILFESRPKLPGIDAGISDLAVVLFLVLSAISFVGSLRVLLLLSASAWTLGYMADSAIAVSGLILIMGGLVLFRLRLLKSWGRFEEFGFDSDDLTEALALPFFILDLSGRVVYANDEFLRMSGYERNDLEGREAITLFEFPDSRRLDSFKREGSKKIKCRLKRADGKDRQVLLTMSEVLGRGKKLQNLLGLVTDEEDQELMQARIRAEASRFASLYETSRALSTSLEIRDVLETIATAAEALTDSDNCTIFILDRSTQMIRPIFSTEKEFKEEVMSFEFQVGKGLTGMVVRDGNPRIENWDDSSRGAVLVPGTSEEEEESLLSVPLLARNQLIGALTLYKLRKKRFEDEQISTLTVFASQASAAIETSRLYMRLKESERIYKNSVNMAADSIFFVDAETGRINDVNEMGMKTFGYRRSELASMHIWELCSKSHMQYARRLWQKAVSDGQGSLSETMCETRDETIIPVSINASRIEAGDVGFVQWVIRDTSEYKNLLDDMQFFRNLVSDLEEPVLVTEPLGVIGYFNKAFENLFAISLRKAEGSTINALSIGNRNLALLDSMRSRLKGDERFSEEIEFHSEKGDKIRKVVTILPSYDKSSSIRHHTWLFSPPVRRRTGEKARAL